MKRKLLVLLFLLALCPFVLFADKNLDHDGVHYYNSVGSVSTSTGIGYRFGRFETGGALSSSALNMSALMLVTKLRPITGFILGLVAFGGVDVYARYDLIPNPRYEFSIGIGAASTYCLFGALDIGITTSISIRTSITFKKSFMLFFESGIPIYYWEFSDSCSPESNEDISYGFVYPSLSFAALAELFLTTRIGAEILF